MADYNKVILIGRTTRDIEIRHTPTGTAVGQFALAINERRKGAEDITHYIDVVAWAQTAEAIAQYAPKGTPMLVEGRLRQERWQTAEGQNRSRVSVTAERVQFLGKSKQEAKANSTEPQRQQPVTQEADADDGMPF